MKWPMWLPWMGFKRLNDEDRWMLDLNPHHDWTSFQVEWFGHGMILFVKVV